MIAIDKKNKSSNQYSIDVGESDKKFTAYFRTENFKQIVDDYDVVNIKDKDFSFCKYRNKPVQYWIV